MGSAGGKVLPVGAYHLTFPPVPLVGRAVKENWPGEITFQGEKNVKS